MKQIIFILFAAFLFAAVTAFAQSKTIPSDVILDEAKTLNKGGACYAMKPVPGKQGDFFPAMVMVVDKGLVIGVSAEKPDHYQHELGEKTNYYFFPNSEVNFKNLEEMGRPGNIALLYENGQWNIVCLVSKTGNVPYKEVLPIAGEVSTQKLESSSYTPKMNADLWKPKTRLEGAVLLGAYGQEAFYWPFSLYSAANQK